MNLPVRLLVALAVAVVAGVAGFSLGARHRGYSAAQVDFNMGEIQTTLQFNHLLEYRRLEGLLRAGCADGALTELTNEIDRQMGLIRDLHQQYASSWADKYMLERDPAIIADLASFKSRHDGSWPAPACKGGSRGASASGDRGS